MPRMDMAQMAMTQMSEPAESAGNGSQDAAGETAAETERAHKLLIASVMTERGQVIGFDSESTGYRREVQVLMLLLPAVGRGRDVDLLRCMVLQALLRARSRPNLPLANESRAHDAVTRAAWRVGIAAPMFERLSRGGIGGHGERGAGRAKPAGPPGGGNEGERSDASRWRAAWATPPPGGA